MKHILRSICCVLPLLFLSVTALRAQTTGFWLGGSSSDWNDAANWDTNPTAPNGSTDTATLFFATGPITFSADTQIGGLYFGQDAFTFTIDSGRTFTMSEGFVNGTSSYQTFAVQAGGNLVVQDMPTMDGALINNSGTVTFVGAVGANYATINNQAGGSVDFSGLTTPTVVVGVMNGAGSYHLGSNTVVVGLNGFDSAISGDIDGLGGSLNKIHGGILTLSGTNTYTGFTGIYSGTLQFAKLASLANSANLTVNGGGTAGFNVGGSGEFSASDLTAVLGSAVFSPGSVLALDTTNAGGNFAYGGIADPAGNSISLVKLGTGSLTLGASSYTGDTTIAAGTLAISANDALPTADYLYINTGGTFALGAFNQTLDRVFLNDGAITGSTGLLSATRLYLTSGSVSASLTGSGNVVKNGPGIVILSGANDYTGGTTVSNIGYLQFANTGALPSTGTLVVYSGSIVAFNVGAAGEFTASDISTILATQGFQNDSHLGLDTSNATGNFVFDSVIGNTAGGLLSLRKMGTGTLELTAANTYSGETRVTAGTVLLSGAGTLGDGTGALVVGNGSTVDLGGFSINVGGFSLESGSVSNGSITSDGGYTVSDGTISANLGGSVGLEKYTSGTVTLSGAASYTGDTNVYEGTLVFSNSFAGGSILRVDGGAAVDFSALSGSLNVSSLNGAGVFDLGSLALTVNEANNSYVDGSLSGATASLTMAGTGSLELAGANSYGGGTTISSGTIQFDQLASLPGTLSVASGATAFFVVGGDGAFTSAEIDPLLAGTSFAAGARLGLNTSNGYTYTSAITDTTGGSLGLTVSGSGILTLSGVNTYTGGTIVSGGTLSLSANEQLGSGGLTLDNGTLNTTTSFTLTQAIQLTDNGGGFTPNPGTTLTVSGAISGSGSLGTFGGGTLLLTAANTNSGSIYVGGGVLAFSGAGTLGDGTGDLTVFGGALDVGSTNQSINSVYLYDSTQLLGSGTLTVASALGAGTADISLSLAGAMNLQENAYSTLTLHAANTFTGDTNISNDATLRLEDSLALQGSTLNYYSSGGSVDFRSLTAATFGGLSGDKDLELINTAGSPASVALTVGANNGSTTYSGILSGAGGSLIKTGSGTLTLSGANTYDGGTTVSAGMLQFANVSALPATGTFAVMSGATAAFNIGGGGEFSATEINPLLTGFQDGSVIGFDDSHGPTDPDASFIKLPVDYDASGLTGNVGVVALGSGFVQLSGNLTYTGDTIVRGTGTLGILGQMDATLHGTNITVGLEAGDQANLATYNGGVIRATNVTAGAVAGSEGQINVSGDFSTHGQLVATNLYVGGGGTGHFAVGNTGTATTVNAVIGRDAGSTGFAQIAGQGNWTNSGNIIIGESGTGTLWLFTSGIVTSGTVVLGANASGIGTLSLNSNGRLTTGQVVHGAGTATVNFDGGILRATADQGNFLSSFGTNDLHLLSGGATLDSNGFNIGISAVLQGAGALSKIGTGTLTLSGANTYAGGTALNAGALVGTTGTGFGSGAITLADADVAFSLSGAANLTMANAITVAAGTHLATVGTTGSGSFDTYTGNLTLNRATTLYDSTGSRTTFEGVISGNVGTLTIAGVSGGRVTTGGMNTFTGDVVVNDGVILQLSTGANQVLPLATNVSLSTSGKLWIGNDSKIGSLAGGAGSIVQVAEGGVPASILTIGDNTANNSSTTFAGTIQDAATSGATSLVKSGGGTLTLSGANTYAGGTSINSGTLALGANNALLSTGALTLNGGTFALGGFSQGLGTLTLSAISTIDFGAAAGANALFFGDSHLQGWTGTLTVLNYNSATDSLRFGTDANGLTAGQLAQINFNGAAAAINGSGFLVAIPEPATYAAMFGLGALGLAMARRRRTA